jgi:phospholipase C
MGAAIEHVFVLMLENRSFDQLLGSGRRSGRDPSGRKTLLDCPRGGEYNVSASGAKIRFTFPADFVLNKGPGHEFNDVEEQLCGRGRRYAADGVPVGGTDPNIDLSGFVANYERYEKKDSGAVMRGLSPEQMPVLTKLAEEFAVCDRWFSSMPGPTWPNRFFIHAASSGGLDDSPSFERELGSIVHEGFRFEGGTVYDLLDQKGLRWSVYCGDEFPQVLSIAGMTSNYEKNFHMFEELKEDLESPDFSESYVFVEPDYHAFTGKFRGGTSQHPVDDVTGGERLLKELYEALRRSPIWEKSLLIVTYDEHGGFYDHVVPPVGVSPGDRSLNAKVNHNGFDFRQLGLRVPTLVISPYVQKGTIDHGLYDHTSALATVEKIFSLGSLTKRDKMANDLLHLADARAPRRDTPETLPEPADSGYKHDDDDEGVGERVAGRVLSVVFPQSVEPSLVGFHHVAHLRHTHESPEEREKLSEAFVHRGKFQAVRYMRTVRKNIRGKQD